MWAIPLVFAQVAIPAASPADAVALARADLAKLTPEIQPYVRYLSLYNVPPTERAKWLKVISGHCNSLSREPDLSPVFSVPGSAGALARVVLKDYRWSRDVWEKLVDPYFSAVVETETKVLWPGGVWRGDGKYHTPGSFYEASSVKRQAFAPWLVDASPIARLDLADLANWTQSKMPIVRADWFIANTATGRLYYELLGIKNRKDFERISGVVRDLAEERGSIWREAIGISGITILPRAIVREGGGDGRIWKSLDFDSVEEADPLEVLGKDIEKFFKASEEIGTLPNNFPVFGLFNKEGVTQDRAPPNIAPVDRTAKSNDASVLVGKSCWSCHNNGGLQDLDGWVSSMVKGGKLDLRSPDYDTRRQLRRDYARDLARKIKEDRASFDEAVREATGMDVKAFSAVYVGAFERYFEPVGLERSAADLGTTPAKWRAALEQRGKAGQLDTVIGPLLEGKVIPVQTWERRIASAHLILRGYVQP